MRNGPDRNPFRGVSDLLSRAAPAKRNSHFLAFLIDLVLVFIASYLLFLGGNAIVSNTDSYKNDYAKYEEEITYYQDMVVEAHLGEYLDRDTHLLADNEDLAVKIAITQILQSYLHDNPDAREFEENPMDKLQETFVGSLYTDAFEPANFSNDYISRFFIEYVPAHNEDGKLVNYAGLEPTKFTIAFYKKYDNQYENVKLVYYTEEDAIPYLRPDVANDIYKFLIRAEGFTRTAYDSFVEFYGAMLNTCEQVIFKSEEYQNGRYIDYLAYRQKITQATDTTLLISIIVGYFLAVFLPQIIFKDGRSFGKIFLRLGTINIDKSEVETWKIILRSILDALSFIFVAFFLVLLPPFNGASMILYLPYITIGTLDIALINIVLTIFLLISINGIVMLLTHERRNIFDFIFKTVTVDVTALDEPDYDERNEAGL